MEERILLMWDQMAPLYTLLYIFSHCVSSGGDLHVGFVMLMNMFLICIEENEKNLSCSDSVLYLNEFLLLTLNHFNQIVFHGKSLILDGDLL